MAGKSEIKRAELKEKLLEAAIIRIESQGIGSLRARDLAKDAGCALGAIYNIYKDLDELVFHAKVEIFGKMEAQLDETMTGAAKLSPLDQMVLLSEEYFRFAANNTNLWSAMFDGALTSDRDIPQWYENALRRLMGHIGKPLRQIDPALTDTEVSLKTRALFSAIHGIVALSIQNRPSGVRPEEVPEAMLWILRSVSKTL